MKQHLPTFYGIIVIVLAATMLPSSCSAQVVPYQDTADEEPDHTKTVKAFIMMGQSNMVGFGQIEPAGVKGTLRSLVEAGNYSYLINATSGAWTVRKDVRVVWRNNNGENWTSDLTVGEGASTENFGPELQFGHVMGHILEDPVLILKVGTGNRALGWDFLPPGSERYEFGGFRYPGYGECPLSSTSNASSANTSSTYCKLNGYSCPAKETCPVFFPNKKVCGECWAHWYAGKQYDSDLQNAKFVLDNIRDYYPGYQGQGVEVAGFVFWQGYRDTETDAHAKKYEENLKRYIGQLKSNYATYGELDAKFVLATIAFNGCGMAGENFLAVYNAQLAVSSTDEFEQFVTTVDARKFWRDATVSPKSELAHYNWNAETYMEVGNGLGWAMADLLQDSNQFVQQECTDTTV